MVVPEPSAPLEQAHLFKLMQEHRAEALNLARLRLHLESESGPKLAEAEAFALNGDAAALVTALLRLSQETLLIHALATAEPGRPVAEVLTQAVRQLKWS